VVELRLSLRAACKVIDRVLRLSLGTASEVIDRNTSLIDLGRLILLLLTLRLWCLLIPLGLVSTISFPSECASSYSASGWGHPSTVVAIATFGWGPHCWLSTGGLSLVCVGVDVGEVAQRLVLVGQVAVVGSVGVRIDIVLILRLVCRLGIHVRMFLALLRWLKVCIGGILVVLGRWRARVSKIPGLLV
jgi:hypothetical protein